MKIERLKNYIREHTELVIAICIAILVAVGVFVEREYHIEQAEQSTNIMRLKEYLERGGSISADAEGWAERKAMKKVIDDFNQEHNYISDEERYTIYKLTDENFWITSEELFNIEHDQEAGKCMLYIAEMLQGIETETKEFLFIYAHNNQEQYAKVLKVISECSPATADLDISIGESRGDEATIIKITVAQNSNLGGGDLISPPLFAKI